MIKFPKNNCFTCSDLSESSTKFFKYHCKNVAKEDNDTLGNKYSE